MNTVIIRISYVCISGGVYRYAVRMVELTIATSLSAPFRKEVSLGVELLHSVFYSRITLLRCLSTDLSLFRG